MRKNFWKNLSFAEVIAVKSQRSGDFLCIGDIRKQGLIVLLGILINLTWKKDRLECCWNHNCWSSSSCWYWAEGRVYLIFCNVHSDLAYVWLNKNMKGVELVSFYHRHTVALSDVVLWNWIEHQGLSVSEIWRKQTGIIHIIKASIIFKWGKTLANNILDTLFLRKLLLQIVQAFRHWNILLLLICRLFDLSCFQCNSYSLLISFVLWKRENLLDDNIGKLWEAKKCCISF